MGFLRSRSFGRTRSRWPAGDGIGFALRLVYLVLADGQLATSWRSPVAGLSSSHGVPVASDRVTPSAAPLPALITASVAVGSEEWTRFDGSKQAISRVSSRV